MALAALPFYYYQHHFFLKLSLFFGFCFVFYMIVNCLLFSAYPRGVSGFLFLPAQLAALLRVVCVQARALD